MNLKEEHIIDLVVAYSKGELSVEERAQVSRIFQEKGEDKKRFIKYYRIYKDSRSVSFLDKVDENTAWLKINAEINKPKAKSKKLHFWIPYAAAVAIIAFVSAFLFLQESDEIDFNKDYNFAKVAEIGSKKAVLTLADGSKIKLHEYNTQRFSEKDGTQIIKDSTNNISYNTSTTGSVELIYNTIEVPRGGEYSLTLSDGTKVWLNADTKLRYPVRFENNRRNVYLTGEAYFEVAHNTKAPFKVRAHDSEVKVLGTSFNISAYDEQEIIATTLVEGSVQIKNLGNNKILEPGEQSTIIRGRNQIEVRDVDTHLFTSWVNGVYEFEGVELEYIMAQLGRWYDVKFFFTEEQYKHIRFTGAIKRDKSFGFALQMIENVADVKFAVKGNYIVVGRTNNSKQ